MLSCGHASVDALDHAIWCLVPIVRLPLITHAALLAPVALVDVGKANSK